VTEQQEDRRRIKALYVPDEILCEILLGNQPIRPVGIPSDADLVRIAYDHARLGFILGFRHSSFEIVEQGDVVPEVLDWEPVIDETSEVSDE